MPNIFISKCWRKILFTFTLLSVFFKSRIWTIIYQVVTSTRCSVTSTYTCSHGHSKVVKLSTKLSQRRSRITKIFNKILLIFLIRSIYHKICSYQQMRFSFIHYLEISRLTRFKRTIIAAQQYHRPENWIAYFQEMLRAENNHDMDQ